MAKRAGLFLFILFVLSAFCAADNFPGPPLTPQRILIRLSIPKKGVKKYEAVAAGKTSSTAPKPGSQKRTASGPGTAGKGEAAVAKPAAVGGTFTNAFKNENEAPPDVQAAIEDKNVAQVLTFAKEVENLKVEDNYDTTEEEMPMETLLNYDQVWDLRVIVDCTGALCPDKLTEQDKKNYQKFLSLGKGLLLVGAHQGHTGRNASICDLVTKLIRAGTFGPVIGTTPRNPDGRSPRIPIYPNFKECALADNFATDYMDLSATASSRYGTPGGRLDVSFAGVVANWGTGHPLYQYPIGGKPGAVVVAFLSSDLKPAYPEGKLMVAFEQDIFTRSPGAEEISNVAFIENTIDFLSQNPPTATPTETATLTPSATSTRTPSWTATPFIVVTLTPTNTLTLGPVIKVTAIPTRTYTPAKTLTAQATPTPVPVIIIGE